MYQSELLFPINSPVKEAILLVDAMPNEKLAQMAVALQVLSFLVFSQILKRLFHNLIALLIKDSVCRDIQPAHPLNPLFIYLSNK